jgi:hypothetical protein
MVRGYNNYSVVSSEGKSLVFVGKASRRTGTGDTAYIQDNYKQLKGYLLGTQDAYCSINYDGVNRSSCYSIPSAAYGAYILKCMSETSGCASATLTLDIPDDSGYWTYTISGCDTTPTVFINSSDIGYNASVLSIRRVGTTSTYEIRVVVTFPIGGRSTAASKLTFYCFHSLSSVPASSGYGMELYNAAGELTFSATTKPAFIGDVLKLSAISGDTTAASVTWSLLADAPNSVYGMSKPSALAVDWARPSTENVSSGYTVYSWDSTWGKCDTKYTKKHSYTRTYVGMPPTFNPSTGAPLITIVGMDLTSYKCHLSNSTTSGANTTWNTIPLPIYFPIIDGADYD